MQKVENSLIKEIINNNFTWGDMSKKYENIEMLSSNIFCPYHDHNYTEGNAKFYYNEETGLWSLYCFVEKKIFYVYDYVNLIMCRDWQKYRSPLDFLEKNMGRDELATQIEYYKNRQESITENAVQLKIEYINNIMAKHENITDYIEELYTA